MGEKHSGCGLNNRSQESQRVRLVLDSYSFQLLFIHSVEDQPYFWNSWLVALCITITVVFKHCGFCLKCFIWSEISWEQQICKCDWACFLSCSSPRGTGDKGCLDALSSFVREQDHFRLFAPSAIPKIKSCGFWGNGFDRAVSSMLWGKKMLPILNLVLHPLHRSCLINTW